MVLLNQRTFIIITILGSLQLIPKIDASIKVFSDLSSLKSAKIIPMNEINVSTVEKWNKSDKVGFDLKRIENILVDGEHYTFKYGNDTPIRADVDIVNSIYKIYYKIALAIVSLTFGVALDVSGVGRVLKRPIGILIAAFCNYIFSPLVSNLSSDSKN